MSQIIKIIKATYGDKDITDIIQNKAANGILTIRADNNITGDPRIGVVKFLEVTAEIDGAIINKKIREGHILTLPETSYDRLGIFYADNIDDRVRPAVIASLQSIQKAALNKADIITCMWKHEPENPFKEIIAQTQTRSHLNQILQILQLLYTAKEIGNYRYVSFLESDLLYAEEYFDYPDFQDKVLFNMNYMGINKTGFQNRKQHDRPTSQMHMLFDDAIAHFNKILPNALVTNNGCLEPVTTYDTYQSKYPNIHINHGRHFTSHFSIYDTNNTYLEHPYWGDHGQYKDLFF